MPAAARADLAVAACRRGLFFSASANASSSVSGSVGPSLELSEVSIVGAGAEGSGAEETATTGMSASCIACAEHDKSAMNEIASRDSTQLYRQSCFQNENYRNDVHPRINCPIRYS